MKPKDKNKEIAIIEKTLDIVHETGIAGVKMSKLAKRVGISPSTLYVYFKTKEDLMVSIGLKIHRKVVDSLESALTGKSSFESKLRAKWIHMLQFHLNNEKELNFIDQLKQSPYFEKLSSIVKESNVNFKMDLFEDGRKSGYIKKVNDNVIHAILAGMAKQTARLIKEGQLDQDKTSMDMIFNIVWDALKK